jgi:DNA-binding NarL/FixJ family response regulator
LQNILLIQDDRAEADSVRDALTNSCDGSFRVVWVRHCSDGLKALAQRTAQQSHDADRIEAVVVDLSLPDSIGIETFDRIFQAAPQVPILILAAAKDEDIAKLAVQRGAQEYLLKGRLDAYLWPKVVSSMIAGAANTRPGHTQFHRRCGSEYGYVS